MHGLNGLCRITWSLEGFGIGWYKHNINIYFWMLLCFITLKGCVTNIGQLAAASAAGADLSMWSTSQISSEWFGWWLFIVIIIIIVTSRLGMLNVLDTETYFFLLLYLNVYILLEPQLRISHLLYCQTNKNVLITKCKKCLAEAGMMRH